LRLVSPVNGSITLPTGLEWKSSPVEVGRLIHLVETKVKLKGVNQNLGIRSL
jgi:hypothetical protein